MRIPARIPGPPSAARRFPPTLANLPPYGIHCPLDIVFLVPSLVRFLFKPCALIR